MLSNRTSGGSALHLVGTAVDRKLMERSGLDELNLRRARRAFMASWNRVPHRQKQVLIEGPICHRFRFVTDLLRAVWPQEIWALWLLYLEHTEADIAEMGAGEYPISPYLIRLFSALLGIKVDFLLMGTWPTGDQMGTNIDAYPATLTHA